MNEIPVSQIKSSEVRRRAAAMGQTHASLIETRGSGDNQIKLYTLGSQRFADTVDGIFFEDFFPAGQFDAAISSIK